MIVQNIVFGESEVKIHHHNDVSLARYPVDKILPTLTRLGRRRVFFMLDGFPVPVKRHNQKYMVFGKSCTCVKCGRVGNMMSLDRRKKTYFFNLFCIENNKAILMTKDHIKPKSKSGTNTLDNYQTMCAPCNSAKGDRLEKS